MPNKPVKIVMLTGYLGAGKTTLTQPHPRQRRAASAPP